MENLLIFFGIISTITGFCITITLLSKVVIIQRIENLANQVCNDLCNPKVKQSTYKMKGITFQVTKSTLEDQLIWIDEYRLCTRYRNDQIQVTVFGKENILYQRMVDVTA